LNVVYEDLKGDNRLSLIGQNLPNASQHKKQDPRNGLETCSTVNASHALLYQEIKMMHFARYLNMTQIKI
jgi:hypothetical protein